MVSLSGTGYDLPTNVDTRPAADNAKEPAPDTKDKVFLIQLGNNLTDTAEVK